MLVKARAYPHPVLSHFGDDIVGSLFQSTVAVKGTKTAYHFDVLAKTSNSDLRDMVKAGRAKFAIHVECATTRYRQLFAFDTEQFTFQIPAADVDGRVEVCSFIVSEAQQPYANSGSHVDYKGITFVVNKGDTLAVAPDASFIAEKKLDPLRRIPSVFVVVPDERTDAPPFDIDTSGHKIQIRLSVPNYEAYRFLRTAQPLHATLNCLVIIPALIAVIEDVKRAAASPEGLSSLESRRWFVTLSRRLKDLGIDPSDADSFKDTSPSIAQRLIGEPLTEAFKALKSYEESDEEEA